MGPSWTLGPIEDSKIFTQSFGLDVEWMDGNSKFDVVRMVFGKNGQGSNLGPISVGQRVNVKALLC